MLQLTQNWMRVEQTLARHQQQICFSMCGQTCRLTWSWCLGICVGSAVVACNAVWVRVWSGWIRAAVGILQCVEMYVVQQMAASQFFPLPPQTATFLVCPTHYVWNAGFLLIPCQGCLPWSPTCDYLCRCRPSWTLVILGLRYIHAMLLQGVEDSLNGQNYQPQMVDTIRRQDGA